MKLIIDDQIIERFLELILGAVVAKNIDNSGAIEEIQVFMRIQEQRIREHFTIETLPQHPKIDPWRKAYSAFGAKPKEHKSSIENLYRMVLGGTTLRHINTLVDCYNYISLKHMVPVGGEDLDKIEGDITLRFAGDQEPPVLLLGDKEPRAPHAGEVIYKDDVSAICRRFNWREADRTKLTEQTKNCILVMEGLPPVTKEDIVHAAKELSELVEKYCGGTVHYDILDKDHRERAL